MTIKLVSEADIKSKLGARITKMSPIVRTMVLSGQATLAVEGMTYRAVSNEQLALVHKAAHRIAAELEPEPERRRDLLAEYNAERLPNEPASPAVRAVFAAEREAQPTAKRTIPETAQQMRIRNQQEADERHAKHDGRRPSSKLVNMLGGDVPKSVVLPAHATFVAQETSRETRIRVQREADRRLAARQDMRPGSRLAGLLDGRDPKDAA